MHDSARNGIDNSTVHRDAFQAGLMTVNQYAAPAVAVAEVQWPVVVGRIPAKASAFQPRSELRQAIDEAREQHGTVVLSQVLAGGGGVGKTQLAAHYAREALDAGAELVLWVDAAEPATVTDVYARAALAVRAPGVTGRAEDAERDAERFLGWLATTGRSWLIVLDNTTEDTPDGLWPATGRDGCGRVIATTRHRGAASTGSDRALVDISTYSPGESAAYLRERMERAGCGRFLDERAGELAEELGHLPLALAHAAAYMINTRRSSGRYLELFRDRSRSLDAVLPARSGADGYRGPVAAALLLSVDAAQKEEPVGLALPALRLAALLDPAGHPEALWEMQPVLDHLGEEVDAESAAEALAVLHNYNLITLGEAPNREVTLHALTARAALDTAAEEERPYLAAADGLVELWPEEDHTDRELAAVLRANAEILGEHAGDRLWEPSDGPHPLPFRAGSSLHDAGLHVIGIQHWDRVAATTQRILGPEHEDALTARVNLAFSYWQAGQTGEAIAIEESVLADRERILGSDHPDTLTTRNNLAASYQDAGRNNEAITLKEGVLADRERLFGTDHPDTLNTRHNLAVSYHDAGRTGEAITLLEQVLASRERILGTDHPDTLSTRNNLATSYQDAGRNNNAITLLEQVLAARDHILGTDHPNTLTARNNLATSYSMAGRTHAAIALLEQTRDDTHRVLGTDHPLTLAARHNLAVSYQDANRTDDAVTLLELALAGRERVLGTDHPDTLTTRNNLAASYSMAGHHDRAVTLLESVLADRERVLGADHPNTLLTRVNLARCCQRAGRRADTIRLLRQALAEYDRVLGSRHPDTVELRTVVLALASGRVPTSVKRQQGSGRKGKRR